MLTPKQNMLEVIKGGNPDRFVNQYEAVQLLFHPFMFANPLLEPGQENVVNAWGVTNTFPKGVPGSFPVHTPDKIVVKDIEDWQDYVHAPSLKFTQDQWDMVKAQYDAVDGEQAFLAQHENIVAAIIPGEMRFEEADGTKHVLAVSSGFVEMINNRVKLFCLTAESPEEIDIRRAQEAKERAEEQMRQKQSIQEYHMNQLALSRAMARLRVTSHKEI